MDFNQSTWPNGTLAQLVEHRAFNPQVLGSSPRRPTIYSDIAQLVEQVAVNHLVAGSSPAVGAISKEVFMKKLKNVVVEYIWLDGYATANLRSKVKVIQCPANEPMALYSCPDWNFDGSSTKQAPGSDSECLLKPVKLYEWDVNHYFVLCEVFTSSNKPHPSNYRALLSSLHETVSLDHDFWWGFEQEYFITKDFTPLGFPAGGYPKPQGLYYCGVGGNQVHGRSLVERHLHKCLEMGITLTGTNAEVAVGQWEYQCFAKDTLTACDDLWVSRYVLYRLAEQDGLDINIEPKPVVGDWNGSGCHTNFSNKPMRELGDKRYFMEIISKLGEKHLDHITDYGENNSMRLTGDHETQHIDKFSWGIGDRSASVRVPSTVGTTWSGYLEDRRPASNCDPYKVTKKLVEASLAAHDIYNS